MLPHRLHIILCALDILVLSFSTVRTPRNDVRRRHRPAGHPPEVANERFELPALVCRRVSADFMLGLERDLYLCMQPPALCSWYSYLNSTSVFQTWSRCAFFFFLFAHSSAKNLFTNTYGRSYPSAMHSAKLTFGIGAAAFVCTSLRNYTPSNRSPLLRLLFAVAENSIPNCFWICGSAHVTVCVIAV